MTSTSHRSEQNLEQATAAFHAKLDELQFQGNLDDSKFVVLDQDGYGFGAQFERRALGLQLAYMFDRTAIFVNEHNHPYTPCFEPTSQYTYKDIEHLPQENLDFTTNQTAKVAFFDFDSFWQNPEISRPIYDWVPPDLAFLENTHEGERNRLDLGFKTFGPARRYMEGQILSRFSYLPAYATKIEEIKKRIGFQSPIIGAHIRRGDKYVETPYVPIRRYHAEILRAVEETGINRVFVTSDDPEVFANLPDQDNIKYIFDDEEPRYNNANHVLLNNNPELASQETLTGLKIYELLSNCDVIVGQNNAHLTLLAIARNAARHPQGRNFRLTRGDYTMRFGHADPRDWGDVLSFKLRRSRRAAKDLRKRIRSLKRAPAQTPRGRELQVAVRNHKYSHRGGLHSRSIEHSSNKKR